MTDENGSLSGAVTDRDPSELAEVVVELPGVVDAHVRTEL
jgi:hypothetical protein